MQDNNLFLPTKKFGHVPDGNYSEFENDGTLVFKGDATIWDDLRFPLTRALLGILNKPDYDFTNLGLLFPQNDTSEIVYIIAQISHKYKIGSSIYPHIHWVQSQATEAVWKMDYRWYDNGDDPTGGFTTLTAGAGYFTYPGSGSILQQSNFPAINGSGIDLISSFLDIKLYRDDNLVTGDVLAKEFDIHFEIDTIGSRSEQIK